MSDASNRRQALSLTGVRVLELSHIVAGPSAGMMLGDLGADVIKIEHPATGDTARSHDNAGGTFYTFNRNKKYLATSMPAAVQFVKEGRIRAIATSGAHRARLMPDVPTIAEAGFPSFETIIWHGMLAPAKTPREVIARLNREIVARALVDTGAVVALLNRDDRNHRAAVDWFQRFRGQLLTTEAVITETAYVLAASPAHQHAALVWFERARSAELLRVEPVADYAAISGIIARYASLPCDYADATLIALAASLHLSAFILYPSIC